MTTAATGELGNGTPQACWQRCTFGQTTGGTTPVLWDGERVGVLEKVTAHAGYVVPIAQYMVKVGTAKAVVVRGYQDARAEARRLTAQFLES